MTEPTLLPDQPRTEAHAGQTGLGRAFAGITLAGGALLVLGPHLPWMVYGRNLPPITAPFFLNNGTPSDALFATVGGVLALCLGAIGMAARIPTPIRVLQILLAALFVTVLVQDFSLILGKNATPGGGAVMAMVGTVMVGGGSFPLPRPSLRSLGVSQRNQDVLLAMGVTLVVGTAVLLAGYILLAA